MDKKNNRKGAIHMPINGKDILKGIAKKLYDQQLISYEEYLRLLAEIEVEG